MLSFEEILQRIDTEIKDIPLGYPPETLFGPIEYILSLGGKRIRPALALMACNIYSEDIGKVIKPALGMEVFHNFTLLHDDLMDEADKRRNKPTVHKVWNANTAILSGDTMLILACQLIGQTDPDYLKEILDVFTQTAIEICCGQQYDMEFEARAYVTEEEYLEMIRLKTAVLLACCLKTGAILGGASPGDIQHLYDFGINTGIAFQLQDDLLDVYGSTETFGKNIGGDIITNKKTFLLINALEKASENRRKTLSDWIAKREFDPAEKIFIFTEIYDELNIRSLVEAKMKDYYTAGLRHLNALIISPERLTVLKEVCDKLMYRKF
jgi:geranylgeranyl diphosphate synthase type II